MGRRISHCDISFGKFLQLSFSQQAVTECGDCAYRNSLRFFGIGSTVACFLYNLLPLVSLKFLPPLMEFTIHNPNETPDVALYEDEYTSIISHAMTSHDYIIGLQNPTSVQQTESSSTFLGCLEFPLKGLKGKSSSSAETVIVTPTPRPVKVQFTCDQKMYEVNCYHEREFIALRAKCCGGEMEYIRSLRRCQKWDAQGGKSKAYFAKTLDNRFILKEVSSTEKSSFEDFAPQYFSYLWDSITSGNPTFLAKILGFYSVTAGKEKKKDVLVMENLTYGKTISRIYDLKGSTGSRHNKQSTGTMLDGNFTEDMKTSPLFMTLKSKILLEQAIQRDTSFLMRMNVMDYSMLVVVSEDPQELVIGIIDYIRQYTWDKHLETWWKASRFLGWSKHAAPTVISPKGYKIRFENFMSNNFPVDPLVVEQ